MLFRSALNDLAEFYQQNEYEVGVVQLYNRIIDCSCGNCNPGYELDTAAQAYIEEIGRASCRERV